MRAAIVLLLMVFALSASAEWVKVFEDDNVAIYADPTTIRKNGPLRRMWELADLKGRNPASPQSNERHNEYDCFGDRIRTLETIDHSESMGKGRVVSRYQYDDNQVFWVPIPRRTTLEPVLKFVCER